MPRSIKPKLPGGPNDAPPALTGKQDKVLTAAEGCLLRYGFRRTTMEDIATAAGVSRPALYLLYASKEDVLRAVLVRLFATMLTGVTSALHTDDTLSERLARALDVWYVRTYLAIRSSPDAADLLENSRSLAAAEWSAAEGRFEMLVAAALDDALPRRGRVAMPSAEVAHVLTAAVRGFKETATSGAELQRNIRSLVALVLSGLGLGMPSSLS